MAKKLLALFDRDLNYVNRFMGYVKDRKNLPFKMAGFSEMEPLMDFIGRNRIDVLLISDDGFEEKTDFSEPESNNIEHDDFFQKREKWKNTLEEYLKKMRQISGIGEIIILSCGRLNNTYNRTINKYQSAEGIVSEIIQSLQVEESGEEDFKNGDVEIIAVYSPACDLRKQKFSLCLANRVSKSKSVLYINLERFSGLRSLLEISKDISLSDIIYFYTTDKSRVCEELSYLTASAGNFDCLTAPLDMEDLDIIGDDHWMDFIGLIASAGGYDCVIVDVDESIKKINAFFEICSAVYVPVTQSLPAGKRLEEFKDYLKLCGKERILEKIVEVNVDEVRMESNSTGIMCENYLQECFLGKMQVIVDNVCSKGAECGA